MNRTRSQEYVVSVLIADDESVSRKLFSRYLEIAGFKVMTARNGEEALAKMTPEIRGRGARPEYAGYGWARVSQADSGKNFR